jgi:hypothetical protein
MHWMHNAGISRQIHAVYESATRVFAVVCRGSDLRAGDSFPSQVYPGIPEQRARMAAASYSCWPDRLKSDSTEKFNRQN